MSEVGVGNPAYVVVSKYIVGVWEVAAFTPASNSENFTYCCPELDAMSNHVLTEHGEKDKCKSTADNIVTTQSSGVEYVNELEEENINLKEENIKLKEQVKMLEENLKGFNLQLIVKQKKETISSLNVKLESIIAGFFHREKINLEKISDLEHTPFYVGAGGVPVW